MQSLVLPSNWLFSIIQLAVFHLLPAYSFPLRDLQLPSVMTGDDRSGSTAIAALVTPRHLIVANCGDSRCILVRRGDVVEMSDDHKPYNEGEQRRIVAAGGTVTMRRVNGDLAVSRALGDFVYKHTPTLPPESQQVSAEPEIRVVERSPGLDQYLLLACDGVWDVMTNEEAGGWILSQAAGSSHSFTPTDLAAGLIDECLQRGSRDNMSAVVVAFKQGIQAQKTAAPAAPTAAAVNGASGPSSSSAAATAAGGSDDVEMASSSSSSSAAAQVASSSSATHSSASGGGSSSGPAEAHAAPASSAAAAGSSSSSSSSSAAAAGGGDPEAQSLRGVHESSNSSSSSSGATSDRPGDLASSSAST